MNSTASAASNNASSLQDASSAFSPLRFAVLLLALICAAYPEVIFGGNSFCFRDFGLFGYPIAHYHRECFWRGEIPLWNPLNNCGMPFLAQWNTLTLYPGSLFYLLFPLTWSLSAFCLGHLFFAGMTMYWLAHYWTGNRFAATVAGLAFALNGLTLNCLMWPNNIAALGWMPLVILLVERAWREGGLKIVLAAAAGAMQMLTGAPEIIFLTWIILGTIAAAQFFLKLSPRAAIARRFFFVVALVAGLSAVQLLPFLDLLRHSQRTSDFGGSAWPMPPTGWANFLVPLFSTFQIPQGVAFQFGQLWTSSYYVGIGVLGLALFAAWQVRDRRVWFLAFIAVAGLILALGSNGFAYAWLQKIVPLGFMRFPIKFVVLSVFALPLLAAFGLRACSGIPATQWKTIFLRVIVIAGIFLALIAVIIWYSRNFPMPGENWKVVAKNGLSRALFLLLILATLFAAVRFERVKFRQSAQWLFLLLIGLDLLTHAPKQNPTVHRSVLEMALPPLRQLNPFPTHGESRAALTYETAAKLYHTFTDNLTNDCIINRLSLHGNCNLLEDISKLGGFYSLDLPETHDVVLMDFNATNELTGLKDFLGVSQVSAPGRIGEWTNRPSFLPMVTGGQKPVFADSETTLTNIARPDFDATKVVYLPLDANSSAFPTNDTKIRIENANFSAHHATINVQAQQAGLIVIAQAFYHPWVASVDGRPEKILRANHGFQAIQVPPGQHTVRLFYRDRQFCLGLVISVLTFLICVLIGLKQIWRKGVAS